MEKRRRHFDLGAFKAVCGDPRRLGITTSASKSAAALGFVRAEIAEAIRSMKPSHFYKSMTSHHDHTRWQDVYHVPWDGVVLYVKFTDDVLTEFMVLSFKER